MVIQRAVSLGSHIETHSPRGSKVISCTLSGAHTANMSTKNKLPNLKAKVGSAQVSPKKMKTEQILKSAGRPLLFLTLDYSTTLKEYSFTVAQLLSEGDVLVILHSFPFVMLK